MLPKDSLERKDFVYVNSTIVHRCYVYDKTPLQHFMQCQLLSRDRMDMTPLLLGSSIVFRTVINLYIGTQCVCRRDHKIWNCEKFMEKNVLGGIQQSVSSCVFDA